MEDIAKILDFIVEIEKLKAVLRKTRPVGLERYENSGEHSWHVCLSALLLKDYSNESIDINRVIKMLLVHDLGEIDVGDTIVYNSGTVENKSKEEACINRVLNILPEEQRAEYLELWHECELAETPEAKYAKAIDRIPPLLHNINDEGHSWKKNNIPKEKVFALNSVDISQGSEQIWSVVKGKLETAVEDGILE
ncbi:phosphohydrolase [Psychromonas sp. psych-6C06]|uniref:HD domain-containing protein n=1 Tax=Psychromonas sp. psych-6C06 TaxID=2058089 RepID=UPI000C331247|nr:HD domain-containing protein [Psychromonas sp. psych-6C06]PKF61140.1 phosphohydrolase [Psychromonas sp. psych-6C06]